MINRLKSYVCVHRRPIEVALIICALLLGGGVTGYALGRLELRRAITATRIHHLQEIESLQHSHRQSLLILADRIRDVTVQQSRTADDIARAANTAKSAASIAQGAAKNAARANIRVSEAPEPKSPFTEVDP